MKVSGFIWFVQQVYMIIIASLMFWLNFLLGFVFLGTTFSFKRTFAYIEGTYYDKYHERTKEVKLKFEWSNLILLFTVGVFTLASHFPLSNLSTFLILVSLAYFVLTLIYIIFKTYYRLEKFTDVMQKLMGNWTMAIYSLMLIILAIFLTGFNRVWFLFFIPGLFCKMIDISFKHLDKKKMKIND